MPSSFGSKSQSGLSNGPSARAACIGASARGSSPRSTRDSAARSGGTPRRVGSGSRPACRSAIVRPEITEESSAISSREGSAASSRCLNQQPAALLGAGPHERPRALQLAAAERDRELAAIDALEDARLRLGAVVEGERAVLVGGVGAVVPDDHLARAVFAPRDHALEGGVAERVILRLDREPPLGRVRARARAAPATRASRPRPRDARRSACASRGAAGRRRSAGRPPSRAVRAAAPGSSRSRVSPRTRARERADSPVAVKGRVCSGRLARWHGCGLGATRARREARASSPSRGSARPRARGGGRLRACGGALAGGLDAGPERRHQIHHLRRLRSLGLDELLALELGLDQLHQCVAILVAVVLGREGRPRASRSA